MSFRIIKVGNKAVSVAICALTGLMVTMSGTANALDYFNAVANSPFGQNGQTVNQYSASIAPSTNHTSTDNSQDVIFRPTGVTSTYTGYTGAAWTSTSVSGQGVASTYTITFTTGAQANDIYKFVSGYGTNGTGGLNYSVNGSGGYNATGVDYTSNLVFQGINTITGSTNIESGAITVSGGPVYFAGAVTAGSVNINGGDVYFSSNVGSSTQLTFNTANKVSFQGAADLAGSVNFNGYNATLELSSGSNVSGNIVTSSANSNSGLISFMGNSTVSGDVGASNARLRQIDVNGNNATTVNLAGMNYINLVNINTAGNLVIGDGVGTDGLDTTGTVGGRVDFNNTAGTIRFANTASMTGDIVSTGGSNGATVNKNNQVIFSQNGTMTGQIGTSASNRIGTLRVGDLATGTVSLTGNVYANSTEVVNSSTLNLTGNLVSDASLAGTTGNGATLSVTAGDITGNVSAVNNGYGVLTLTGGSGATANTQVVSGTVGSSVASLSTVNAGADGMTSNFSNAAKVYATTLNVTGTGVVNLSGGLEGNASFTNGVANENGTLNVAANKSITGAVGTSLSGTGILNLQGGAQTVSGNITGLNTVNANTAGANTTFGGSVGATTVNLSGADGAATVAGAVSATTVNVGAGTATFNGAVTATTLNLTTGTANLNQGMTGNLDYDAAGTVNVATNKGIVGAVTNSSTTSQGTLNFTGNGFVTQSIGSSTNRLAALNAGANSSITWLNSAANAASNNTGMSFVDALTYTGNGTVVLNGKNGGDALGGLSGSVDFAEGTGTLRVGDGVNLTTGNGSAAGTQFLNANTATLTFDGSSTVTGTLGGGTTGRSTFQTINAGANSSTVNFLGDVHVASTTFNVTGTGTVNFSGDLYGPLEFDADGLVTFANGKGVKNIVETTNTGTVKNTTGAVAGNLNYLGNTTLANDLGENLSTKYLKNVYFHSDTTVPAVSQTIDKNIYAQTTTIGNITTSTTANVTGNVFLGDNLTLVNGNGTANVTLNTAGTVTTASLAQVNAGSAVSLVDFAHIKNANNGTLSNTATVTRSTTGTGAITTNNSTLNFVVATNPWNTSANTGVAGTANAAASSRITGDAGSSLVLSTTGAVNVSLLGSLRSGATYTLIDVSPAVTDTSTTVPATLRDNSFVIDTTLTRSNGDLVLNAARNSNSYVTKSDTVGHFSNAAAQRLGALGATGYGYTSDMQTVFNKLDIDQWGYGNNASNLSTQVQRLAPVVNLSLTEPAFAATSQAYGFASERLAVLRGDVKMDGLNGNGRTLGEDNTGWVRFARQTGKGASINGYDGFTSRLLSFASGVDTKVGQGVVGAMVHGGETRVLQQDFRAGDDASIGTLGLGIYGTQEYDATFVEASLGLARHSLDSSRAAAVGRIARMETTLKETHARLAVGHRIALDGDNTSVLTPMLSVERSRLRQPSYTETGAGDIGLEVDENRLNRTKTSLGLRYSSVINSSMGFKYYPSVWIAANRLNMDAQNIVANYIGDVSKTDFTTVGVTPQKSSTTLGLNLRVARGLGSEIVLGYQYESGQNHKTQQANVRVSWAF